MLTRSITKALNRTIKIALCVNATNKTLNNDIRLRLVHASIVAFKRVPFTVNLFCFLYIFLYIVYARRKNNYQKTARAFYNN